MGGVSPPLWAFGLGEEGVVGEVLAVEVGFAGLEIRHASRDDSGSVSCATELEVFPYHTFQLLLQLDQVDGRC
jgi:hypothetical protein